MRRLTIVPLLLCCSCFVGCGANVADTQAAAIRACLREDARLAQILRASAIDDPVRAHTEYVTAMGKIDMRGCPEEFTRAFLQHRTAWSKAIPFARKYEGFGGFLQGFAEGISGSDDMEVQQERILQGIADTWTEVTIVANRYGVDVNQLDD